MRVPLSGLKSLDSFSQSAGGGLTFRKSDKDKKGDKGEKGEKEGEGGEKRGRRNTSTKFDVPLKGSDGEEGGGGRRGVGREGGKGEDREVACFCSS